MSDSNLTEPFVVMDIFATDLALVEHLGSCTRFTFVAKRNCPHTGNPEREIVARLVIPAEALSDVCLKVVRAHVVGLERNPVEDEQRLRLN
jgi:hypothetical protein